MICARRDSFDAIQQHTMRQRTPGVLSARYGGGGQVLDASRFQAAAAARQAYQVLVAAAGAGDLGALQQMEALRRQLGPVRCWPRHRPLPERGRLGWASLPYCCRILILARCVSWLRPQSPLLSVCARAGRAQ